MPKPYRPPLSEEERADQFRRIWPMITWRDTGDLPRTLVVVHSVSVPLPRSWEPLLPAYEERYLCYLLGLASGGTHVVYVSSMPILPRLVDYWFSLVPELDSPEVRSRLTVISVVDPRPIALTRKVLEHPGTLRRIEDAVADPDWAVIVGHMVAPEDLVLSERLGIPIYGPTPSNGHWGTKNGSREAFAGAEVPCVPGVDAVRNRDDVTAAIDRLLQEHPDAAKVIVKLDEGVSGLGNGTIRLDSAGDVLDTIDLEDPTSSPEDFYGRLDEEGGVVEVFLEGAEVRSPSVQLRTDPDGAVEIMATHEQLLGGAHGLSYLGCAMPAAGEYATEIAESARSIGAFLGSQGVIGRFAVDFMAVRDADTWTTYALEINLREGGTTHPLATLTALCGGGYDEETGGYLTEDGEPRCYKATDHMESPAFTRLTTDDVLDLLDCHGMTWSAETRTGAVFHMASAIAANGVIGVTAISETPQGAEDLFEQVRSALVCAGATAVAEDADLFAGVEHHLIERVMSHGEEVTFAAGELAYTDGDLATTLYVVLDGAVDILESAEPGSPTLKTLGPGHAFGVLPLLRGGDRTAAARAATSTTCFTVDYDDIRAVTDEHPGVLTQLYRNLSPGLATGIVAIEPEPDDSGNSGE